MKKRDEIKTYVVEAKTGRIEEACKRYGIGATTMRQIAKEAGAVIRIGKIFLVDFSIMDEYMAGKAGR